MYDRGIEKNWLRFLEESIVPGLIVVSEAAKDQMDLGTFCLKSIRGGTL